MTPPLNQNPAPLLPLPTRCGRNRKPGRCGACGHTVAAGAGDLLRGASWSVYCRGECRSPEFRAEVTAGTRPRDPRSEREWCQTCRAECEQPSGPAQASPVEHIEAVATFVRARFATHCRSCGGPLAKGEQIHWLRDARGTQTTHAGECPTKEQP